MKTATSRDRIWMGLCVLSAVGYLACSRSVRAFSWALSREVAQLFSAS